MKLMTKQLKARFKKIGDQKDEHDPIVVAVFFDPTGPCIWYATAYDPEKRVFYGYVSIPGFWDDGWGYFKLNQLESIRGDFGLGIERDRYFKEQPSSQAII